MWNDYSAQNNAGVAGGSGAGFFNSPNQFGGTNTPAGKAKKTGKRNSRTAPFVIAQALRSSDDGLKLWGSEVQIACIVAKICNINVQSAKIVYTIEDITGRMKAMLWVDRDSMDGEDSIPNVMEDTYVQIFGNIKTNRGKKVMVVFKMLNITNVNAITFHYLQCINNRIKMEAKSKGAKDKNNSNMGDTTMPSNSFMSMDTGGSAAGLNPRQSMVFNLIRAAKVEEGTSKNDMQTALRDKMSKTELEKILEFMCGEGHIYSTIDEDHFRATDAS